jgi:hypothetical protein
VVEYTVDYVGPGRRSVVTALWRREPLEPGQWISVDGVHLIVERVKPAKSGDPNTGTAFCRLAAG